MANTFKNIIDRNVWVQVAPAPNAHAAGMGIAADLRNDMTRNPFIFQLASASILNIYNAVTKGWIFKVNPGITAFAAGAGCVFAPSFSMVGNIGAGCSTTSIVTTTTITAVGPNQLANRGGSGDYGFRIRIIGNAAGSSGKIEERWIVGNTGGTTPTITLDSALTFTPANGDTYEIMGGRLFMLSSGAAGATSWRSYNTETNALTSLAYTGLPTISTDFSGIALDETYVPYNHIPGEGFIRGSAQYDGTSKYCLTAVGTGAGSITGQASGGDDDVLANEYRNFQIRIVEDTSTPTAVNQRRMIASHTAGPSPVYTLGSNWSVTPSSTAKYVIEYPNLIVIYSTGNGNSYVYNYTTATINNGTNSITTNTWSTSYFAVRGQNMGAGCTTFASFGIQPDVGKNARHSYIFSFRGGGATTLDLFDIAGGTTGAWSNAIVYDGQAAALPGTGSCGKYAPFDNEGRYGYLNLYVNGALNQMYRFDVKNRVLTAITPTDQIQSGSAGIGGRLATLCAIDGTDKYTLILLVSHLSTISQEMLVMN